MNKYFKKFSIMFVMLLAVIGFGMIQNGNVANAVESKYVTKKDYSENLVAKWVFDDSNPNYVQGNTIKDISGNGHDGTMNNVKFVDDEDLGRCAYFNGTNADIEFNDKIVPLGKKSVKINLKKTTDNNIYLMTNSFNGNLEYGCSFECSNNTMRTILGNASSSTALDLTSHENSCNNAKGNILLYTWDGTTNINEVKMYSGNLEKPITMGTSLFTETSPQTRNLYIGKVSNYGTFEGYIKSIEIYNDALEYGAEDESIILNKSTMNLAEGDSQQLTATTTPAGAQIAWISSDPSIATVDSTGKVTGVKEGTCTITAITPDGAAATCAVTVTPKGTDPTPTPEPTDTDKIVNIAHAKGDNTNNPGGDVIIIYHGAADTTLSVVKTADVKEVWVGDTVTYTIVVTNTGTKTAKAVVVNDPAPNHIDFNVNAVTTTQGTIDSSSTSKNIVVNVGDIPPAGTVTITIPATVIA